MVKSVQKILMRCIEENNTLITPQIDYNYIYSLAHCFHEVNYINPIARERPCDNYIASAYKAHSEILRDKR